MTKRELREREKLSYAIGMATGIFGTLACAAACLDVLLLWKAI